MKLAVLSVLALAAGRESAPGAPDEDPLVALCAAVDGARMLADVERLAAFHTRHSASVTDSEERGIGAARRFLRNELEAIARETGGRLEVREQTFTAEVRGVGPVEMTNVYGWLPGQDGDPLGRTYVVSGHYDSRARRGDDAEAYAPGADDDASGTAVVLELARLLSARPLRANVAFLCVAGEEQGLFGARHFAEWARDEGLAIDGMLTDDIVGGVEGGNGVRDARTVRCYSGDDVLNGPSRELARSLMASARRYVPDARIRSVLRLDRFGRGGDHVPFHELGFPAVRLSEANEHYARQHEDVREEDGVLLGDRVEFVSPDYLALAARVNLAAVGELALAPPAPTGVRMRAAVSYDTQLSWDPSPGEVREYEVVWRETTAPDWEHVQRVAPEPALQRGRGGERLVVRATVENQSADVFFFGVRAVGPDGHRSRVTLPDRP